MAGSPASQLVSLCTGYGAVPTRIPKAAPFLRDLPATQHAQQVLYPNGEAEWQHAARDLLVCVTKPGGASGLDERAARFVRACLGINGALESYTKRMDDLANDPEFSFWKSRNAQDRQRDEAMGILAARLLQLQKYPCDPGRLDSARRLFDSLMAVVKGEVDFLGEDEQRAFFIEAVESFVGVSAFFDHHDPNLGPEQRLRVIVAAVVARPYRQLYDQLKPRSFDLLVPPDEVLRLYDGRPSLFGLESAEAERTMRLIERIIIDIEERGDWDSALLATATAEEDGGLSQAQALRLRAYFDRLTD